MRAKERSYRDLESKSIKIGCLNVRGCNRTGVMEEIGSIFEEKNLDIFALCETKLNWTGGLWFGNIWGRSSGSKQKTNAREGVAILLKKDLCYLVEEWKMVSSRIMSLVLRIKRIRWVFICAFAPDPEEFNRSVIEQFWDSLNLFLMEFNPYDKIVLIGDLNARVGEKVIEGIIGLHGMPGKDYNGEKLIELCRSRGLLIGNTYFKKEFYNKYTWESYYTDKSGNHISDLIDYICVNDEAKFSLLDVHTTKGGARGLSDHYLLVGKVKLLIINKNLKEERELKERLIKQRKRERQSQKYREKKELKEQKRKEERERKEEEIREEKEMKENEIEEEREVKEPKIREEREMKENEIKEEREMKEKIREEREMNEHKIKEEREMKERKIREEEEMNEQKIKQEREMKELKMKQEQEMRELKMKQEKEMNEHIKMKKK